MKKIVKKKKKSKSKIIMKLTVKKKKKQRIKKIFKMNSRKNKLKLLMKKKPIQKMTKCNKIMVIQVMKKKKNQI